jgi:hypothetical protein
MPAFNTLYGDSAVSSADDFITIVGDFWTTYAANHLNDGCTFTTFGVCTVVDPTTGQPTGTAGSGPDISATGSAHGDPIPYSSQGLGQIHTGVYVNGRELRGRIFLPGATEDDSVDGKPATGYVSDVAAQLVTLSSSALCVYSPTHHMFASNSTTACWNQWAVLRSRRD